MELQAKTEEMCPQPVLFRLKAKITITFQLTATLLPARLHQVRPV